MTTKVNNTVSRLTAQGTRNVALGIIKIIKSRSDLWLHTGLPECPIVVSEHERIDKDDLCYHKDLKMTARCVWTNDYQLTVIIRDEEVTWLKRDCIKVLVDGFGFSPKHLSALSSKKYNHDDKVWVVCKNAPTGTHIVDLDKNGHMTMVKYSDEIKIVMPLSLCHGAQVIASGTDQIKCTSCGQSCSVKQQEFVSRDEFIVSDELVNIACGFAMDKLYSVDAFKNRTVPTKEQMASDFRNYIIKQG